MNISSFFIDRPIFASVLSIIVCRGGLVSLPLLPVSEFPEVVPPTVVVRGRLPRRVPEDDRRNRHHPAGAADQRRREHALHVNSSGDPDGSFTMTVTFRLGTNLDDAQVQTQNRVTPGRAAPAGSRAPDRPRDPEALAGSHDGRDPALARRRYDSLYLRNYAMIQIRDVLARLPGMGDVRVFGSGDYAMRLWLIQGRSRRAR